jgi:hypothetical protein
VGEVKRDSIPTFPREGKFDMSLSLASEVKMKWFILFLTGFCTFVTGYQLLSLGRDYREMAAYHLAKTRDENASPDREREARDLHLVYSKASLAITISSGFACAIISSVVFTLEAFRSSAARIRAMEEELRQLRSLTAGS